MAKRGLTWGGTGGLKKVTPKPKAQPGGGFKMPPFMTFPPSINAQRRAQQRGLKDILQDTGRAETMAREDAAQKGADIATSSSRGYQDIGQRYSRGVEDITQRQQRGEEDFTAQLGGLIRSFQVRGREQRQAANQAGVLGGSTEQAAAARRGENLAVARRPIDVGRQRLQEDTTQGLSRLGEDVSIASGRLGEDTARDTRLSGVDLNRTVSDLLTKRNRAIREQRLGDIDLIQEAIFQARQMKPGAFTQYGGPKGPKAPKPKAPKPKKRR